MIMGIFFMLIFIQLAKTRARTGKALMLPNGE